VSITVLYEPLGPHPLAWIHRIEARRIATELKGLGHAVRMARFSEDTVANLPPDDLLLRVSDPVMLSAAQALNRAGRRYIGPDAKVMARCYDKYEATRFALSRGVDCPVTTLTSEVDGPSYPMVLKPRSGSDSLGLRILRRGPIPRRFLSPRYIVQERIRGFELTVGLMREHPGYPLRLFLPEGTPYSFARKYFFTPRREVLVDNALSRRVRDAAVRLATLFEINWAARADFIYDPHRGRLYFLECDAAPLVGPRSTFATSLEAAGIGRLEQLALLVASAGT